MNTPHEIILIQEKKALTWHNGLSGYFKYDKENTKHYFIEVTSDLNSLLEPEDVQLGHKPQCKGFISYLIANLGKKTTHEIYESYLTQVEQRYISYNQYDPDIHSRNLLNEFYENYFMQETMHFLHSNNIYSFIKQETEELIQKFICGYEVYLRKTLLTRNILYRLKQFDGFKNLNLYRLSVVEKIDVMKEQYKALKECGFIDCEEKVFLFRMGFNVENNNIEKIKWTAINKKSFQPNKKSLIDYLTLIGITEKIIKNKVNFIFEIPGGKEFKPNNFEYENGVFKSKSEYHNELVKIVTESKQK